MKISLLINILLFIGAAQGFLLVISLVSISRGNKKANRILASLLFIYSVIIFFHSLGEFQQAGVQTGGGRESHVIMFLIGPLFLYYTKALTNRTFTFRLKDLLHLLPCAGAFALNIFYPEEPYNYTQPAVIDQIVKWSLIIQGTIYLVITINILRKHASAVKDSFSSIDRINLSWLRFLTAANAIVWPIAFIVELYKSDSRDWNIIWLLVSILIYLIGYKAIKQPVIFSGEFIEADLDDKEEKKKYGKSSLSVEQADSIYLKLQQYMSEAKPYLEGNLTLPLLAKQLSVSVHHLSRIINERKGENFFEFINKYRVEEAKKMLKDPQKQNITIASIGLESGFNSLSSFNSVFKKNTNMTPSQYQKTGNN